MIHSLKEIFPHIEEKECLQLLTQKSFEILDHADDKRCYILEKDGQFKVINPYQKEISFIAIDECLFRSSDGSRADCAIYDEEVFCFIELKDCKNKNISANRRKAKEQLIATIEFFRKKIDIKQKLEAYICITCSTNKEKITMTPRASNSEAELEFEEFLDTQLFYRCEKLFTSSSSC
jgi:hypothetical protein